MSIVGNYRTNFHYIRYFQALFCILCLGCSIYHIIKAKDNFIIPFILKTVSVVVFLALTLFDIIAALSKCQFHIKYWAFIVALAVYYFAFCFGTLLIEILEKTEEFVALCLALYFGTSILYLIDAIYILKLIVDRNSECFHKTPRENYCVCEVQGDAISQKGTNSSFCISIRENGNNEIENCICCGSLVSKEASCCKFGASSELCIPHESSSFDTTHQQIVDTSVSATPRTKHMDSTLKTQRNIYDRKDISLQTDTIYDAGVSYSNKSQKYISNRNCDQCCGTDVGSNRTAVFMKNSSGSNENSPSEETSSYNIFCREEIKTVVDYSETKSCRSSLITGSAHSLDRTTKNGSVKSGLGSSVPLDFDDNLSTTGSSISRVTPKSCRAEIDLNSTTNEPDTRSMKSTIRTPKSQETNMQLQHQYCHTHCLCGVLLTTGFGIQHCYDHVYPQSCDSARCSCQQRPDPCNATHEDHSCKCDYVTTYCRDFCGGRSPTIRKPLIFSPILDDPLEGRKSTVEHL